MDTQRLRQKILDLAIRGKLVEQDPDDEPASVLLERIHAEKLAMVKRGELKPKDVKNDSVIYVGDDNLHYEKVGDAEPVCIEDEIPFELPEGWAWSRISCHYLLSNGTSKRSGKAGNPTAVLRLADLSDKAIDTSAMRVVNLTSNDVAKYSLVAGDLVFIRVNGSREKVGRCYVFEDPGDTICLCDHLIKGRPTTELLSAYISAVVCSELSRATIDSGIVCASGQNTVSQRVIGGLLLPIPPLAEQHRIVAALDECHSLVDRIEQEEAELEEFVAKAKAKVLDLAIRGKLVEQDPDDEPASALLERIHAEKLAMVERGELPASAVKADTVIFRGDDNSYYERDFKGGVNRVREPGLYPIPDSWSWTRLKTLNTFVPSSLDPRKSPDDFFELYSVPSMPSGFPEHVQGRLIGSTKTVVAKGDILLCKINPKINRVWFVSDLTEDPSIASSEWIVMRQPNLMLKYIVSAMRSPMFREQMMSNVSGVGGSLTRAKPALVQSYLLPIPPLNEQKRVADAIEAAFGILDAFTM